MARLVSRVEIAELLGVTPQRVHQLIGEGGFPAPLITLAIGQVWEWETVKAWAEREGRIPYDDEP